MLAAIAGYTLIGCLISVTNVAYGAFLPVHWYFGAALFSDTVYSVAGGFLCARVARSGELTALILMMAFGEVFGLSSQVLDRGRTPLWFAAGLLLGYPPAVWLGWKLFARAK